MRHKTKPIFQVPGYTVWHTPAKRIRPLSHVNLRVNSIPGVNNLNAFSRALQVGGATILLKGKLHLIVMPQKGKVYAVKQNLTCSNCNRASYPHVCSSPFDCLNYY